MSIDRPLWYIFLLISLLNLCCVHRKVAKAALVYNNGYDYLDALDKSLNYLDSHDIPAEGAADEAAVVPADPDADKPQAAEYAQPLLLLRRAAVANDADIDNEEMPEEHASEQTAGLCMGTNAAEAPPAVRETQDAIEHVTGLIKAMREHAISMIKDMSELESQFLSSCDECGGEEHAHPTTPEPSACTVCSASGNRGGSDDFKSKHMKTYNINSNPSANSQDSRGVLKDVTPAPMPYYFINEYGAPVKNSSSLNFNHQGSEYVQQAQRAVKSWKEQIESCRRMLDDAVVQASQNANLESGNGGAGDSGISSSSSSSGSSAGSGIMATLQHARLKDAGQGTDKGSTASAAAPNTKNEASGKGATPTNAKSAATVAVVPPVTSDKSGFGISNDFIIVPDANEDSNNNNLINNKESSYNSIINANTNTNNNKENSYYNTDASFDNVVSVNDNENNVNVKKLNGNSDAYSSSIGSGSSSSKHYGSYANDAGKRAPSRGKNYRKRKYSGKYDKLLRDSNVWSSV